MQRLQALGVRHLRDGLIDTTWQGFYDHLNALGNAGIKSCLITTPDESAALLGSYYYRVSSSIEAFEAPNEYDASGDPAWVATLKSFLPMLYSTVKNNANTAAMPVIGPALTQQASYAELGDQGGFMDFANMHNYLAGYNPGTAGWGPGGYGSIAWNLALGALVWDGKPVWTTENGYNNDPGAGAGQMVPEDISATYMPRLLLEQFLHGVKRTYLFELLAGSSAGDDEYALIHIDGTAKPAFNAVQNLLQLLTDKGTSFSPGSLSYGLTGNTTNMHQLLLQKRNGMFFLLMWLEEQGYDPNTRTRTPVPAQSVTLQFSSLPAALEVNQLDSAGALSVSAMNPSRTLNLSVTDKVMLVEIEMPANAIGK